jgi:hypothetical protein
MAVAMVLAAPSRAEISSAAPGNLFVSGQSPEFKMAEGADWEVKDFWGRSRASGKAVGGKARTGALPAGWYQITAGSESAMFGIVLDRRGAALPHEGKVCADAASAWLIHDEDQRVPFAKMVRMAGIPWVRERMRWNEVAPSQGSYHWGRYDAAVDSLAAEGVHVCEVWHDTADWAKEGGKDSLWPSDLRDIHDFARDAAAHFKGKVQAWEVWNEPDIFFWPELADRFGGLVKASALGLKEGDPSVRVLQGALCSGVTSFACHLLESSPGAYFDTFNWHIYKDPTDYRAELDGYRGLFKQYGVAYKPSWVSEAGVHLSGTEGPDKRLLNAEDLKSQARFVPKSVAESLAAGNEKHFYFVLPDFLERGLQYGALQPDLTPHPSFLALSAAANFLGLSRYLGKLPMAGATVHVFSLASGPVAVVWADKPVSLNLPASQASAQVADLFGSARNLATSQGSLVLTAGPEAQYVFGLGPAITQGLVGAPEDAVQQAARLDPPPVFAVGHCGLPYFKDSDAYLLGEDGSPKPFDYQVSVYNFGRARAQGSLRLQAPAGWGIEPPSAAFSLGVGKQDMVFHVSPKPAGLGNARLVVWLKDSRGESAASTSYVGLSPKALQVVESRPLNWSGLGSWKMDTGTAAVLDGSAPPAGPLHVHSKGERWFGASLDFGPGINLGAYDGVSCGLSADPAPQDSVYGYFNLALPGGDSQTAGHMLKGETQKEVFLFRDMDQSLQGLDRSLRKVLKLKFSVWTSLDAVDLEVRDLRLVKMGAQP